MIDRNLERFVQESNAIEGILRPPTVKELTEHEGFLALDELTVEAVCRFCWEVAGVELRDKPGRNVRVGKHVPPVGGRVIRTDLEALLEAVNRGALTPYEAHVRYELLHPFMDGNGRSGRAIWLWQMQRDKGYTATFALSFLHRFYYQALDGARAGSDA